jgi:hypothetical protein
MIMMKTIFLFLAGVYEGLFYDENLREFFDALYKNYAYEWMAFVAFIIPLVALLLFYLVYKNPYATRATFITWWLISMIITMVILILIPFFVTGSFPLGTILGMMLFSIFVFSTLLGTLLGILIGKSWSKLHAHIP